MKKIYFKRTLVVFMLMLVLGLAACNGGGTPNTTASTDNGSDSTTESTEQNGSTTTGTADTTETQVTKPVPNMMGQDFVIMVN